MHIGEAGDPLTAYIALTRVQDRHGLFVYRPFPAAPFQKGAKVGRELLLRFWGGEKMDWSALRAKYRDERQCKECNEAKPASAFTAGRWKRADTSRRSSRGNATAWKQEDAFKAEHARPQATFYRICKTCEQTQVCSVCKTRKDEKKFSAGAWKRARTGGRVCLDCSGKAWGWWRCSVCKVKQAACAFESWLAQHRSCNGDQVCSNCWKCPIFRGSISKAVQRVAAMQAKVAMRARKKKKHMPWLMSGLPSQNENGIENRTAGKRRKQSRRPHSADKTMEQKCPSPMSRMRSQNKNGNETWTTSKHRKQSGEQSNAKTEQTRPEKGSQTCRLKRRKAPSPATRRRCQQRKEKQRRKESCANTLVRIAVNPWLARCVQVE